MASNYLSKGLKRSALTVALGLCFAGGIQAQSTSGSIFGKAAPGQAITIVSDTGLTRNVTADANGKYSVAALPAGHYKVTSGSDSRDITVLVAGGAQVDFVSGDATTLGAVVVSGSRLQSVDVSQTDSRTVFTAQQLQQIAVPQDVNSVALLSPGVINSTSYNSSSANVGSFGGSAASENAYYINGYPVTNPLTNIGATTLGFDSIAQQQVLLGGYGAEYGRSTGGVISLITKRGSNEWKGGVYAIYSPKSLKGTPENIMYPDTGHWSSSNHYTDTAAANNPANWTDGTLYQYRRENKTENLKYGVWASGPIVKDRLFIYANAERSQTDGNSVRYTRLANVAAQGWNDYTYTYPRWTAKVDWNITDNHVLEFTAVQDNTKYEYAYSGFNYANLTHDNNVTINGTTEDKARLYIGNYTGYFGENLTIKAMYGEQKIDHLPSVFSDYDSSKTYVSISDANIPGAFAGIKSAQKYSSVGVPTFDKTKGYRFDVIYTLGKHELRAGLDHFEASAYRWSGYSGPGYYWSYGFGTPGSAIDAGHGVGSPASGGGLGSAGYYVSKNYSTSGGNVRTVQNAYYIEDRWQVTDNLLLSLGVRNDGFDNYNGDGIVYVSQKNNWAPRLGFSWDVKGDSSLKVYGNAGRYHLAMPNNVAIRGANGSLITQQYFTYTGINADGTPSGLNAIPLTSQTYACPNGGISSNIECGIAPDPRVVSSIGLKAHYQDEYLVGMDQVLNDTLTWGAKVTYRELKSAIDDSCPPGLGGSCFIMNPGQGNSFWIEQPDGSLKRQDFTAAQLGLPGLKRKYAALDTYVEFNDGKLYGKVQYTLSHNWGNTEGQLNSSTDTGTGGQADVSTSQDWDLLELMIGANGSLPNNRTHQIKAFGSIKLSDEWSVGGSAIVQSGRPRSCTSYWPYAKAGLYNGAYYYYCGLPGAASASNNPANAAPESSSYYFSPRGTAGETPWTATFNVNVTYKPNWLKGLSVAMDVLNLFNTQTPSAYYDRYAGSRTQMSSSYNRVLYYTDPRSVRFTARYDF